jgi:3-phosphoshikimate 1-carboxyvinyltransferase
MSSVPGARLDWRCLPSGPLRGTLRVPGDKSITHRALILGALAHGTSEISGALDADDCRATAAALRDLGAKIETGGTRLRVTGGALHAPAGVLDLGNSGTGLRLLAGVVAGQSFSATLTGDESLRRRPMRRIAEPLARMGARVETSDGHPPVTVTGASLRGVDYALPVPCGQVKSAILLAALAADGVTRIHEPIQSRDHTERLLPLMGCQLRSANGRIELRGPVSLRPARVRVPGDFSSAAFFVVAATLCSGSALTIPDVGVNPTRIGLIDALRAMGARIEIRNLREDGYEPVGDLRVEAASLRAIDVDPALVPRAIDELPVLFIAAAAARGCTRVRGAGELRAKESDRLAVMATGLRTLGIAVEEHADGLDIMGGTFAGGTIDSHGDHRVAMAFAVAAQVAREPVEVRDVANVATSFPDFASLAGSVGFGLELAAHRETPCASP